LIDRDGSTRMIGRRPQPPPSQPVDATIPAIRLRPCPLRLLQPQRVTHSKATAHGSALRSSGLIQRLAKRALEQARNSRGPRPVSSRKLGLCCSSQPRHGPTPLRKSAGRGRRRSNRAGCMGPRRTGELAELLDWTPDRRRLSYRDRGRMGPRLVAMKVLLQTGPPCSRGASLTWSPGSGSLPSRSHAAMA
jgi:hypothetical protein